ncbi:unnamed protein product [Paramecium octaurelia]|uniref:Uncharacterized protein n=1 Tax=Paramecium octaurelia TaxID=43137 RepID=A0A8S1YJG9_PAROT|nr:unnamed protein product [Paramecium octaurelia]
MAGNIMVPKIIQLAHEKVNDLTFHIFSEHKPFNSYIKNDFKYKANKIDKFSFLKLTLITRVNQIVRDVQISVTIMSQTNKILVLQNFDYESENLVIISEDLILTIIQIIRVATD